MIRPVPLADDLVLRLLHAGDAPALTAAYVRNRAHLAPWEPRRDDSFFTEEGQAGDLDAQLANAVAGASVPLAVEESSTGRIVGRFTLSAIIRGPFQSANLGYWVDGARNGRGLATSAVRELLRMSRHELGLHRIQAATLPHNAASQRVLERNGFERIGFAPRYLQIDGRWQDHDLFQAILHD